MILPPIYSNACHINKRFYILMPGTYMSAPCIITLFYFLLAFSHCIAGLMRGAGRATVPMFVMLGCWCVIRVTYITIAVKLHPVIQTVFWAYPLTWSLSSILFLIFYLKSDWIHGFEKKRN